MALTREEKNKYHREYRLKNLEKVRAIHRRSKHREMARNRSLGLTTGGTPFKIGRTGKRKIPSSRIKELKIRKKCLSCEILLNSKYAGKIKEGYCEKCFKK